MLPFKLIYSDGYYLPIGAHVFPAEKYKLVHDRLLASGAAEPSDFVTPSPASDQDILLVHTPSYVEKLKTGTLSPRASRCSLRFHIPRNWYAPFGSRREGRFSPLSMRFGMVPPLALAEDFITPSPTTAKASA
jgi:acetoin utilization deacetylase AcuC-like enzyme